MPARTSACAMAESFLFVYSLYASVVKPSLGIGPLAMFGPARSSVGPKSAAGLAARAAACSFTSAWAVALATARSARADSRAVALAAVFAAASAALAALALALAASSGPSI